MRDYRRFGATTRLRHLLAFLALHACSLDDRSLGARLRDDGSGPPPIDSSSSGSDSEASGDEQRPDLLASDADNPITDTGDGNNAPKFTVRQLSVGYDHVCAIRDDQSLWCWGSNTFGELGSGTAGTNSAVPKPVVSDLSWQAVSAGAQHSCAISDGALYCWGANIYGTLGLGSFGDGTEEAAPRRVGTLDDWASVSAGLTHTCAIRATQQLYCWGALSGIGTVDAPQPVPTQIGTATGWTQVAAGFRSVCGILGGRLHCWGSDEFGTGVLGTGDGALALTQPTLIDASFDWQSVSVGSNAACAMRSGSLYCWGLEVAAPSNVPLPVPTPVSTWTDWADVSVASESGCAVRAGGETWCWGSSNFGVRGAIEQERDGTMTPAQEATGFQQVDVGHYFACGLRDSAASCWGRHAEGQLGVGDQLPRVVVEPVQVGGENTWSDVVVTSGFGCGVVQGRPHCWGAQQGAKYDAIPELVDDSGRWTRVSASSQTVYGLRNGQLLWWAASPIDRLNTTQWPAPQLLTPDGSWQEISAGQFIGSHFCAIGAPEKSLFCAGPGNPDGRLGTGDTTASAELTRVGTLENWQAIATTTAATFGIESGRLFAWGSNNTGELGLGDAVIGQDQLSPQQIGVAASWTRVSSVAGTTCGIESGQLHCWGILTATTSPTRIGTADDWTNVAAGALHACAIRDGELYCWGDNGLGQLGLGTASIGETIAEPTRVGSESDWIILSLAPGSTCGIRGNGTLWCWGSNEQGQLGLGASWSETPLAVQWP